MEHWTLFVLSFLDHESARKSGHQSICEAINAGFVDSAYVLFGEVKAKFH
jgi:hypothetical protein